MRKILAAGLVVAAIIGIGVGVAMWAAHSSSALPPVPPPVADNSTPQHPPEPVHVTAPSRPVAPTQETQRVATAPAPIPTVQPRNLANTNPGATNEWEDKIDDIVGSDDPDTNKVAKLYALFPTLPPDGQEEVAQHLSNLVDDDDYAPLGDMLKNDKLPEGVLDELLADVLNRPNNLKLPLLLTVASDANHSKHDEAKDLLELYLGDDYGTDWNSWGEHMTNWLQQNPD